MKSKGWCLMARSSVRKVMGIVCVLAGIGGVVYAQGTRTAVDGSVQDALLAEVRTLRAEINQLAGASIRTQLLATRLQLQEQRVFTLGRQLVEVQNSLAALRLEIAAEQARLEQIEDGLSRVTDQGEERAIRQQIPMDKAQIEQKRKREQQLRAQEAELVNAVGNEQARWADFNGRLDALERSLPAAVSR